MTIPLANGWVEYFSKVKISSNICRLFVKIWDFSTSSSPLVIVFVLSKTKTFTSFNFSIASLLLTKIPCLAKTLLPTNKEIGVANPKAHGQLTTITLTAKLNAWLKSWLLGILIHKIKVNSPRDKITGTKYYNSSTLVPLLYPVAQKLKNAA